MAAWLILLTIGLPWLGALCVWGVSDRHPKAQHRLALAFAAAGGLVSFGLVLVPSSAVVLSIPMDGVFGDFTFVADGLGVLLAIIAAVIGGLAVIFSNDYMASEAQLGRYYALVLLFIGAMVGLVLTGSLLLMFLFWEITAFCSYALISFHNDDPKAVAGGVKALIVTQLGGVGLLAGAILSYTHLGSYQVNTFLAEAHTIPAGVLSVIAFGYLAAAAAKSAQVPFQTWLPDAMEAPTPVSALIHAATMVNAGVYLLARFYPAFEAIPGWKGAVVVVGLLSALLAAIMAMVANDLKRALAYSTISQLGYMFYAIGTGAVFASQFHLLSHAVFKALLFLGAGAVIHAVGTRDMRQMGGLGKQMPFTRTTFLLGALGLAGLPIANGFFSKELILESGATHGPVWGYLGMLIGAGLTAYYSLRMVAMVFFGKPEEPAHGHDALPAMRFSLFVLAFCTLTTWSLAGGVGQMMEGSLPSHHLHGSGTWAIVTEVFTAPTTGFALGIIALGLAAWHWRSSLAWLIKPLRPLHTFVASGLGFEWINQQVINGIKGAAAALRKTQTGQLNFNVAGVVGGLAILLLILVWGV